MAEKDVAEKLLEAYDDVFADIVNALLFEGEAVIRPEELTDQVPRSVYSSEGKLREIERDVAKRWARGGIRIACIGFENQSEPDADMPLRVFAYDGAEYRNQLLRENRENPRYPVVTLVLYFGWNRRWSAPLTLHEAANVPDRFRPFVPDMRINLFEIAWLTRQQVARFKSDFRIVADYFVQKRENGDYVPSPERLEHVQATLQLLSALTRDHRFEEVWLDSAEKGEVQNMCEVLDRVEQRGIAQGRAQGIAQGRAQGIAQGRAQGIDEQARKTALNLREIGMKPEQIARILDRPADLVLQWLGQSRN